MEQMFKSTRTIYKNIYIFLFFIFLQLFYLLMSNVNLHFFNENLITIFTLHSFYDGFRYFACTHTLYIFNCLPLLTCSLLSTKFCSSMKPLLVNSSLISSRTIDFNIILKNRIISLILKNVKKIILQKFSENIIKF